MTGFSEGPFVPGGPSRKRFRLKRFGEIRLATTPNYLIKGILPRVGLAVIWGQPKCGKSFWTFDTVMHVVLGWEYRGRKVKQGAAVYCALEGGTGFARRVEAWRQRYLGNNGNDGGTVASVKAFITESEKARLRARRFSEDQIFNMTPQEAQEILGQPQSSNRNVPFSLDVPLDLVADQAVLIETISEQLGDDLPPACVVIDTLNRALAGSENKPEDMSKFIRAADALRVAFNCLVVIVHHCGLEEKRPRGHSSLPGADDVQIKVERDSNGTGNTITTTVEHMKDDEAGAIVTSRLERVELGADDDREEMSSCVIVDVTLPQKSAKDDWGNSKTVKLLRRIIMTMLAERGTDLRPWADGPIVRALKLEQVKTEFFKAHYADGETERAKQNAKRIAFKRAVETAVDKRKAVIREIGGVEYIWLALKDDEAKARTVGSVTPTLPEPWKEQLRVQGFSEQEIASLRPEQAKARLLAALATVLAEWKKAIGVGETRSLDQVIKIAADRPSLKAALVAVAPTDDGETISNVRLARWLRDFNEVPVNGLQLSGGGVDETGSPLWTLKASDEG